MEVLLKFGYLGCGKLVLKFGYLGSRKVLDYSYMGCANVMLQFNYLHYIKFVLKYEYLLKIGRFRFLNYCLAIWAGEKFCYFRPD